MDYEKKYKEALEMATKLHSETEYVCEMEMLEQIFPELKESENERIRREMIEVIKNEAHEFPSSVIANKSNSWIAWLEKQKPNQLEEYVFRPYAGCSIESAAIQAVEQQKLGKKVVLAFNGAYIPVGGKAADDIIHEYDYWLEKQGEQKPEGMYN